MGKFLYVKRADVEEITEEISHVDYVYDEVSDRYEEQVVVTEMLDFGAVCPQLYPTDVEDTVCIDANYGGTIRETAVAWLEARGIPYEIQ